MFEGSAQRRNQRKRETPNALVRRFVHDPNSSHPPEARPLDMDPLKRAVQGATVAGMIALLGAHFGSKEETDTVTDTKIEATLRTDEQGALDRMVSDIMNSPVDGFDRSSFTADELKCLTDNLYHEARGESLQGRYAVIFATLARTLDSRYPKSICGVVHQPWQFSWTMDQKILATPINAREYLRIAVEVHGLMQGKTLKAAAAVARMEAGLPHGALFYKKQGFTGSPAVQRFFAKLAYAGSAGTHDFYMARASNAPSEAPEVKTKTAEKTKTVPLPRPAPQRRQRLAERNLGS